MLSLSTSLGTPSPVLPEPVILGVHPRERIDKSLVDKALTIRTIESIDLLFEKLKSIALDSPNDSVSLSALQYLFDRAAGKPTQHVSVSSVNTHVVLSADEVKERLAHLAVETYLTDDKDT